ncbi:MAG: hypothetical protein FJ303_03715 [Planctomycetes bacterium]|nr:hypothetical protein [Planctomycetota bacterium]
MEPPANGSVVRFLTDEDVPRDIVSGLRNRLATLDIVRVQDVGLMATDDCEILAWAASEGRLLITRDRSTVTRHAYDRVRNGLPRPGVFVIAEGMSIGQAIKELELIALASIAKEWRDRVIFPPL